MPFGADRPATAQYEPCVHSTCMSMPALAQNDETGHTVGAALAIGQYVVGSQRICVDAFEPDGQWKPALQLPVGALRPDVWQYSPAVHSVKADRPVALEKLPIGLSV